MTASLFSSAAMAAMAAAVAFVVLVARAALAVVTGVTQHRRLDLPSPPEPSLLVGHMRALMSDMQPINMEGYVRKWGPLFKLRVMWRSMVVLTDPAEVARVNRCVCVCRERGCAG
jgi:hypothetical protein